MLGFLFLAAFCAAAAALVHVARLIEGSLDKWLWTNNVDTFVPSVVMLLATGAAAFGFFRAVRFASRILSGSRLTMAQSALWVLVALFAISSAGYFGQVGGRASGCTDEDGNPDDTVTAVYYVDANDGTANYSCFTDEELGQLDQWYRDSMLSTTGSY